MKMRKRKVHARIVETLVLIKKKEKLTLKKCPEAKINKYFLTSPGSVILRTQNICRK